MKTLLINASNLHVGGGIQVATSVIEELSLLRILNFKIFIVASDEVYLNLIKLNVNLERFQGFEVFNCYGISSFYSGLYKKIKDYDIVLTIFGPLYTRKIQGFNVVGFAQPWIIYPNNEVYEKLPLLLRFRTYLKFKAQEFFFKRHDMLVVELPHVKDKLIKLGISKPESISVINNSINSLYFDSSKWSPIHFKFTKKNFSIGFLGRDYLHKNTSIIPHVKKILMDYHGIEVDFYVTFTKLEWEAKSDFFCSNVINVGPLNLDQCPFFYKLMDAIFFPSLLECFSATPLEAMVMEKPLFASDKDFIRDVCLSFAHYFNPLDPVDVAKVISKYINQNNLDNSALINAKNYAINFSNAKHRALQYLNLF